MQDHTMHFDLENIMFNTVYRNRSNIVNLIILIAKQYIYATRCLQSNLNILVFKALVKQIRNVEKFNAMRNDKMDKFAFKWEGVTNNRENNSNDVVMEYLQEMSL